MNQNWRDLEVEATEDESPLLAALSIICKPRPLHVNSRTPQVLLVEEFKQCLSASDGVLFQSNVRKMDWGLGNECVVLVSRGEETVELKVRALDLLARPCSNPPLWLWGLNHDKSSQNKIWAHP